MTQPRIYGLKSEKKCAAAYNFAESLYLIWPRTFLGIAGRWITLPEYYIWRDHYIKESEL